jgi:hypothetical protein
MTTWKPCHFERFRGNAVPEPGAAGTFLSALLNGHGLPVSTADAALLWGAEMLVAGKKTQEGFVTSHGVCQW